MFVSSLPLDLQKEASEFPRAPAGFSGQGHGTALHADVAREDGAREGRSDGLMKVDVGYTASFLCPYICLYVYIYIYIHVHLYTLV